MITQFVNTIESSDFYINYMSHLVPPFNNVKFTMVFVFVALVVFVPIVVDKIRYYVFCIRIDRADRARRTRRIE